MSIKSTSGSIEGSENAGVNLRTSPTFHTPKRSKIDKGIEMTCDRFIPSRSAMELAGNGEFGSTFIMTPPTTLYEKRLTQALFPYYTPRTLLFSRPDPYTFDATITPPKWSFPRKADKILDAPDFKDDFYCNNLDWGPDSMIGINLARVSYLWSKNRETVTKLSTHTRDLCSFRWSPSEHIFATGDEGSVLSLTDAVVQSQIYSSPPTDGSSIFTIGWRTPCEQTFGTKGGGIYHLDIRAPRNAMRVQAQTHNNVCAVEWNRDELTFATGGNDNHVRIYDIRQIANSEPLFSYSHQAAVKALRWMPGTSSLLLSGGGTADRIIKLMDVSRKELLCSQLIEGQICSMVFLDNKYYVLGLGYSTISHLQCWRYNSSLRMMQKVADLGASTQHGRVLDVAKDPNSSMICAVSSEEMLSLWSPVDKDADSKRLRSPDLQGHFNPQTIR